jgi:beta-phosphoglucomutase-like phosphatase (HAD superfamily)
LERPSLLLDVGGVLLDQGKRTRQWSQLIGDVFVTLRGGTRQAWSEAHESSVHQLDRMFAHASASGDFLSFLRAYHLAWVRSMCLLVDCPLPPDEECLALAARASALASRRVHAALPDTVAAVRMLHDQGYPLHTASGACSLEIAGYLHGMGVQGCFGRLYGADLLNTFKDGPTYSARLFADLGISLAEAVVVDDSVEAIAWAAQAGATTVLVAASSAADADSNTRSGRIGSLVDLPTLLQRSVAR